MKINTFFLRVSACCNLDCDYCYVFKHRDLSWKKMPKIMTNKTVQTFALRVKEYVIQNSIDRVNIIFHGGEPLMIGEKKIIYFADTIKDIINNSAKVFFSLQTNGTLLTEWFLNQCEIRNIGISLSIDGNKKVHDAHRKYKNGKGSHDDVLVAIRLLKEHQSIFEGLIGVIDPNFTPTDVLKFFYELGVENIDLLLPDSTYQDLPNGRDKKPELYKEWLIDAFDAWFFNYPSLKLRTFEHVLASILGESGALDAFGFGNLDYLTIETDGSYHTSDILKITYENASAIGFCVKEGTIEEALSSEKVKQYNDLLTAEALPSKCKICKYVKICGGGSLSHRYDVNTAFNNPTVYCYEMYELIKHAIEIIEISIKEEIKNV